MTDDLYFSETAGSPPQRDQEEIGPEFWAGFAGFIRARVWDGSFAESFPLPCYDTALPTECDGRALAGVFQAENPGIPRYLHKVWK